MLCKGSSKLPEDQHIFELLRGVNQEFGTVIALVISQDPLPPIGTIFSLLQGEEGRRMVMNKDENSGSAT